MKKINVLVLTLICSIAFVNVSCQQQTNADASVNVDSIVNAKVAEKTALIEAKAKQEAEAKAKQELEQQEREEQARMESVRPSGNSLKEREMRYYYDQGYNFGSHQSYTKMDDEWMHKAFLYAVSQHNMSHAGNKNLENSFMAGVAKGRAELKDLQN